MARLLVFLVVAATLLPHGFAAAETPVRITGSPLTWKSWPTGSRARPDNLLVATGNVEVTRAGRGSSRPRRDQPRHWRLRRDGHVILYDGDDRLNGAGSTTT